MTERGYRPWGIQTRTAGCGGSCTTGHGGDSHGRTRTASRRGIMHDRPWEETAPNKDRRAWVTAGHGGDGRGRTRKPAVGDPDKDGRPLGIVHGRPWGDGSNEDGRRGGSCTAGHRGDGGGRTRTAGRGGLCDRSQTRRAGYWGWCRHSRTRTAGRGRGTAVRNGDGRPLGGSRTTGRGERRTVSGSRTAGRGQKRTTGRDLLTHNLLLCVCFFPDKKIVSELKNSLSWFCSTARTFQNAQKLSTCFSSTKFCQFFRDQQEISKMRNNF